MESRNKFFVLAVCNFISAGILVFLSVLIIPIFARVQRIESAMHTQLLWYKAIVSLVTVVEIIFAGVFVLNGLFLKEKKNKIFICITAVVQCICFFPIGTLLGAFTLYIVLKEF